MLKAVSIDKKKIKKWSRNNIDLANKATNYNFSPKNLRSRSKK